jgi:hypothetical protein
MLGQVLQGKPFVVSNLLASMGYDFSARTAGMIAQLDTTNYQVLTECSVP